MVKAGKNKTTRNNYMVMAVKVSLMASYFYQSKILLIYLTTILPCRFLMRMIVKAKTPVI